MNTTDSDHRLLEYLDGTASPADRARIEAWLDASPEARARHAELRSLLSEIASLPPAAPPADLRERVLAQIRTRRTQTASTRSSGLEAAYRATGSRTAFFGRRPLLVAGASFAVGLALGVLALGGLRGGQGLGPLDPSRVTGAMGGVGGTPGESVSARLGNAGMNARTFEDAGSCRVDLELELPAGFTGELADPSGLRVPVAVRRRTGSAGTFRVDRERVVWFEGTSGQFMVEFTPRPASPGALRMTLSSPSGQSTAELPVGVSAGR